MLSYFAHTHTHTLTQTLGPPEQSVPMSNALSRGNILSYYLILQKGIERAIERERERDCFANRE